MQYYPSLRTTWQRNSDTKGTRRILRNENKCLSFSQAYRTPPRLPLAKPTPPPAPCKPPPPAHTTASQGMHIRRSLSHKILHHAPDATHPSRRVSTVKIQPLPIEAQRSVGLAARARLVAAAATTGTPGSRSSRTARGAGARARLRWWRRRRHPHATMHRQCSRVMKTRMARARPAREAPAYSCYIELGAPRYIAAPDFDARSSPLIVWLCVVVVVLVRGHVFVLAVTEGRWQRRRGDVKDGPWRSRLLRCPPRCCCYGSSRPRRAPFAYEGSLRARLHRSL